MGRQLDGMMRAMTWGFFCFLVTLIAALMLTGPRLFRELPFLCLGAGTFCAVGLFGCWLVPQLSGPAKLLGIATALGLGAAIRPRMREELPIIAMLVIATSTARLVVELFFPKLHWSSAQLWTAFLAGPACYLMLAMGGTSARLNDEWLIVLLAMSMGLAAVAPRGWVPRD